MKLTACYVVTLLISGCATVPPVDRTPTRAQTQPIPAPVPTMHGSYHTVRRGETLWRIARSFGLDVDTVADVNQLQSADQIREGERLFIPLPSETRRFLWPVRGSVGRPHASHGVDIAAPGGSFVRASRSGRVAIATQQLSGWGKTVVLDHRDGYLTIYSGLEQLFVAPRAEIRQGMPLGKLGPYVFHFEIRYGSRAKSARATRALLPKTQ